MTKLTTFLISLALVGIYAVAETKDTANSEIRSVKLPPMFQLPLYKKILARRNIVPEVREEDSQDKPAPRSIFEPAPSDATVDCSTKSHFNNGLANLTNALLKPWMHFNSRLSKTASTLPDLFAAKGAMIGSALATPIRLYTHVVNQLARSLSPQSLSTSMTRRTSLFDLPIDLRVSPHLGPDHNAVLVAIQNNAKLIGMQMAQMGQEIKKTGKNISSVGFNLLEFSKKATETLSKAPLIPEETVPIALEPLVNYTSKLNTSTPHDAISSEASTLIPETLEVSPMADELVVLNKSANLLAIAEANTEAPNSLTSATTNLKTVETVSPTFQPAVASEVPVTPALNIVNEEESSAAINTESSAAAAAAAAVTTMEMLAPVLSSSPPSVGSLNAVDLQSNMTALSNSNTLTTDAAASTEQQGKATESSSFPVMKPLDSNSVEVDLPRVVDIAPVIAASTDARNDEVTTVSTLVSTVNL